MRRRDRIGRNSVVIMLELWELQGRMRTNLFECLVMILECLFTFALQESLPKLQGGIVGAMPEGSTKDLSLLLTDIRAFDKPVRMSGRSMGESPVVGEKDFPCGGVLGILLQ